MESCSAARGRTGRRDFSASSGKTPFCNGQFSDKLRDMFPCDAAEVLVAITTRTCYVRHRYLLSARAETYSSSANRSSRAPQTHDMSTCPHTQAYNEKTTLRYSSPAISSPTYDVITASLVHSASQPKIVARKWAVPQQGGNLVTHVGSLIGPLRFSYQLHAGSDASSATGATLLHRWVFWAGPLMTPLCSVVLPSHSLGSARGAPAASAHRTADIAATNWNFIALIHCGKQGRDKWVARQRTQTRTSTPRQIGWGWERWRRAWALGGRVIGRQNLPYETAVYLVSLSLQSARSFTLPCKLYINTEKTWKDTIICRFPLVASFTVTL